MPRKREDLTGRRFGRLTVVGYDHTSPHGDTYWLCECDCGNRSVVIRHDLTSGGTRSCGCASHESEDLSGMKFNMLTVVERAKKLPNGKSLWRCICDCGNETIVEGYNLKTGQVKSCGCYNATRIGDLNRTHGHSKEKIYPVWKSMRARCKNPNNHAYGNYGGRGIRVCDEWDDDFQTFYEWAYSHGYKDGLTIDRIDNDGNYSPDNCRFITRKEQNLNRRTNRFLTCNGKTQTLKEWSDELGIGYGTLCSRLHRNDISDEEALLTPLKITNPRYFEYCGENHTIAEWSRILDVKYGTLRDRIIRGDLRDFEDYFDKL